MNANEFEQLENMMMNEFQLIYNMDIRELCLSDSVAMKPMRFNVGYDATENDCEYEFIVEVPQNVYMNCSSHEIVRYIIDCVKEQMNEQNMEAFEAPTAATAVWCDEL